ncbi:unnamed protein product [Mucor hiemalis]
MVGKKLDEVRTPSLIIDRTILERNCNKLSQIPTALDTKVRVHVKTHKTVEGTRIQLEELTQSNLLQDVLLGFPITPDKFEEIIELSTKVDTFHIFIDNISTLEALGEFYESKVEEDGDLDKLKAFLKVDCGYGRAGVPINDPTTIELAKIGYLNLPLEYLKNECDMARQFRDYFVEHGVEVKYVSIGATPTVKAISAFMHSDISAMKQILEGIDEVHAGAFAFLDRQQVATGLGNYSDVAISVACRIASVYKDRNSLLIDGGALAFSKDTAPQDGFGFVLDPIGKEENGEPRIIASLTKVSQEHGILQHLDESTLTRPELQIGKLVRIIPNHCCLTAACHLFYLITENGSDRIVDVWVPVKGW